MVKPAYIKPYWGGKLGYINVIMYIYIYLYIYKSFQSIGGNHPFVFGGANQFELFSTHKGEGPTEEQMIRPAQNQDIWRFQPTNHQEIVFWFQ
jgi:hypothetical protein